jgi:hypothetical protein
MSEGMRAELNGVKAEVKVLGARVGGLEEASRRMMVAVARMAGDIADIKANMATKTDISALNARMDGFSGLLEDSRMRWAVHADTLARHEARIARLERRRS